MTQRPQIFFVVEDNEMILDTLVENLNDFGYTVYGAHNHAELSTLLKQVKPDMLLIDHFIPEKTGAEITSYLKGRQHKSIPTVILMSAHQHVKEIAKQIGVPILPTRWKNTDKHSMIHVHGKTTTVSSDICSRMLLVH